ncbi:phage virion morphogenesis protein [Alysiella crassa]|uniref:Mu-like prophage protein gpG n=1 Tax=Alysiella crassa TaxID=153491 RepID=A0A376BT39_9NEIS|nr:phage virion morphogenesis protein [Alysiella crassa]UOP08025.1 phage virion morphogenesis protein [Alysiella crassa]SSY80096.1 Mu-like prophage protein gpG [Alysiella crassa]
MIKISVDSRDLERGLSQLLQNVQNRRPMMTSVAAELQSMTEDNFESESWGGQKWKDSKRAKNEGGKTLQKSGQLAASLTTQSGNDFARIGSNKVYAAIHHLGGQAGRGHKVSLPARPYLPIDGSGNLQADGEKRILDIVKDALARGI